eukprot:scaffold12257_cov141-Isochrysis_galbana.AAC.6
MGGARADRAPSVLQPPIPSYKPLGSGRTLARSYLAGFFGTRHPRPPPYAASSPLAAGSSFSGSSQGNSSSSSSPSFPPDHLPPHRLAPHPRACWSRLPPLCLSLEGWTAFSGGCACATALVFCLYRRRRPGPCALCSSQTCGRNCTVRRGLHPRQP